jgi:hypothetical protein
VRSTSVLSDAMAAFKTAIRNSGVERVEWAGYEHRHGIQREIDQLCHVNQRHNEWLKESVRSTGAPRCPLPSDGGHGWGRPVTGRECAVIPNGPTRPCV